MRTVWVIDRQDPARLEYVVGTDPSGERWMLGLQKGPHTGLRPLQHGLHGPERVVEIEADGEREIGHSESTR